MGWRLRLSDKTVRKFAELPIYCQKCSPGNVVSGSIRFMHISAGVRWRGGVKWEWVSWKWRFSLHSFTVIRTFYIHCTWSHDSFQVIGLSMTLGIFQGHWTVSHQISQKNGVWYGKNYYRLLIGNHTLAFNWCYFWWPWSTFEGHFSLGCHFHVHFSNPWHAFASHGLPAIAELHVKIYWCIFCVLHVVYSGDFFVNSIRSWTSKINTLSIGPIKLIMARCLFGRQDTEHYDGHSNVTCYLLTSAPLTMRSGGSRLVDVPADAVHPWQSQLTTRDSTTTYINSQHNISQHSIISLLTPSVHCSTLLLLLLLLLLPAPPPPPPPPPLRI